MRVTYHCNKISCTALPKHALAYFATDVSYSSKMFMKMTPVRLSRPVDADVKLFLSMAKTLRGKLACFTLAYTFSLAYYL
jgi:hypothetical protein